MTLNDLLECGRPLYSESGPTGFEYGQLGSCALFARAGRRMILTARHCLWQTATPSEEAIRRTIAHLWVPQHLGMIHPISFGLANPRVAHSVTYQAATDLAVIDVLNDEYTSPPHVPFFCDLDVVPFVVPKPGDKLVIAGYPKAINRIDYPENDAHGRLVPRRLDASGVYVGEGTAPLLIGMQIDDPMALASFDGMSGSPVFAIRQVRGMALAFVVGIAVREMTTRGVIDFIPTSIIRQCL